MRSWIAALSLMVTACAAQGPKDDLLADRATARWTDEDQNTALAQTVAKAPPAADPVKAAETKAATLRDDIECTKAIHRMKVEGEGDPYPLMVACARQGKWRNLKALLAHPVTEAMPEAEAVPLLAHVIANRGGMFESDLRECLGRRRRLYHVSEARGPRPIPRGSWMMFRGELKTEDLGRSGERIAKFREFARGTRDRNVVIADYFTQQGVYVGSEVDKVGSEDVLRDTGLIVEAELPEDTTSLVRGQQYIVLAKYDRTQTTPEPETVTAYVQLVAAFRPGVPGLD